VCFTEGFLTDEKGEDFLGSGGTSVPAGNQSDDQLISDNYSYLPATITSSG